MTGALLSHKMTRKPVNDQIDRLVARSEPKRERDKFKGNNDKSRRLLKDEISIRCKRCGVLLMSQKMGTTKDFAVT